MWLNSTAKVVYDPYRPGIRKIRPELLVVANIDPSIAEYYRYWVHKRFGLKLQNTAFHPHITIFSGKFKLPEEAKNVWKKHEGKVINFEYSVEVEQHWKFWVLPVKSEQLSVIRKELGFDPNYNFHITFGRMK